MKLSKEVLIEVVHIFHQGLSGKTDVSEKFRQLDLTEKDGELVLSEEYKERS